MATAQMTPTSVSIHNVLIATDFSRFSNAALEFGLALSHSYHAKAEIVFVVPSDEFMLAGPEAYAAAKDASRRDLLELREELHRRSSYIEGEDYELQLLDGDVVDSILSFAQQKAMDLILIGTHGRSGLGKLLMGSVAERVFRHSPIPVLTIGPRAQRVAHGRPPAKILLAADFTPASERAAQYAAALAQENDARLTLLHVLDRAALDGIADRECVIHGIEEKLAALLPNQGANVRFGCRVEAGKITPAILQAALETDADLLVMGVRPWTGILDRFMWPHAYEIVREATCPVLTVRGPIAHH